MDTYEERASVGRHVVVVTTMPLPVEARADLSNMLGDDYIVLDIKDAPSTANIVLTTVVNGRTLRSLRDRFPQARILLTEFDDGSRAISCPGPITHALEAGPDGYYVAHGLEALPAILESEAQLQLSGSSRPTPPMIDAGRRGPAEWPRPVWPPVAVEHGTIVWILDGSRGPSSPKGLVLGLEHIDRAVCGLIETDTPRETGLWAALVAESAAFLARTNREDILVDASNLSPVALAQLQVHVASERIVQTTWPLR